MIATRTQSTKPVPMMARLLKRSFLNVMLRGYRLPKNSARVNSV